MNNLKAVALPASGENLCERKELAIAIAHAHTARMANEASKISVSRAAAMLVEAENKLRSAGKDMIDARAAHAGKILRAAEQGSLPGEDGSTRRTRAAENEAQDNLEAAQSILVALKAKAEDTEWALKQADRRVAAAVDGVLKTAPVGELLLEARVLQADLIARRLVLRHLVKENLVAAVRLPTLQSFLADDKLPSHHGHLGSNDWDDSWQRHACLKPWRAAREALKNDPDAELPVGK
jgi:hypothetical protein